MTHTGTTEPPARSERIRTRDARELDKLRVALRPHHESVTAVVDPFSVVQPDRDLTLAERTFR